MGVLKLWLICLLLVVACGRDGEEHDEKPGEPSAVVGLKERHAEWLDELEAASDPASGWPSAEDCDGTLWAGLAKAAGKTVALEQAEHAPGEVHRRPTPCWTPELGDVGARTTVSRDMLTGYLWGWWATREVAPLQRLADYGAANDWRMGLPRDANQVELRDNLKGALCRAVRVLTSGIDYRRECSAAPTAYLPVFEDYERHIQVLGILLQGEIDAGQVVAPLVSIDGAMLDRLKEHAAAGPRDALFAAALGVYTGDYAPATALLLDDAYVCPSYVRGAPTYCLVHKAFAASIVLKNHGSL